jgi:phosphatidylserine/phosphatidylglycerophosphate/cardiolipin synthase-like enzyme
MNPLVELSSSQMEALRLAFQNGALKYGANAEGFRQHTLSTQQAHHLDKYLRERELSPAAAIAIIEAILQSREGSSNLALAQTLVVTGPVVENTQILKTGSRFIEVVQHAKHELMLATFALYQGDQILAPIHEAMMRNPCLDVTLILNVPRKYGDTTLTEQIVEAYRRDFLAKHWQWELRPKVYHFPASLHLKASERASMHCKFVLADEERCFITSANFTEAAQTKNIEVGIELSGSYEPKALSTYFKACIQGGVLERII